MSLHFFLPPTNNFISFCTQLYYSLSFISQQHESPAIFIDSFSLVQECFGFFFLNFPQINLKIICHLIWAIIQHNSYPPLPSMLLSMLPLLSFTITTIINNNTVISMTSTLKSSPHQQQQQQQCCHLHHH